MTRHEAYNGIYDIDPDCDAHRVFFAFSKEQIDKGMKECGYKDYSEIVHAGAGLCGSAEAIDSFLGEYEYRYRRVAKECDPQKVYDYEFFNLECDYIGNDEEAIMIIVEIFGKDRAKQVKRRRAQVEV